MNTKHKTSQFRSSLRTFLVIALVVSFVSGVRPQVASAATACTQTTAPATTFGKVSQTVSVATAGTYRVWSRIKAPNTTANSYFFQADAAACYYNVGDAATTPANTWTWVNYKQGTTTTPIDIDLTAGTHTLNYIGREADVQIDKVMLLTDLACVPTGLGDNCAVTDTAGPTTSITSPTAGAAVSGTVNIAANATDTSGIAKVEFYVDNVLKTPADTTTPYTLAWDTTTATNASHSLTVKAYDTLGNITTSAIVAVTVNNVAPNAPGDVNGDKRVNAIDLSSLITHDGQAYALADFDKSGTVGAADMAILLSKWTW